MRHVAIAVGFSLVAACNLVFTLEAPDARVVDGAVSDLDQDNLPDDTDGCITAGADDSQASGNDGDNDGIFNGADSCPFDFRFPEIVDIDGDGVDDACDPFIEAPGAGKDRRRCTMSFSNSDLNAALWLPRTAPGSWSLAGNTLHHQPADPGSIVAARDFEQANSTTYDAKVTVFWGENDWDFAMILRGDPATADLDVSCTVELDSSARMRLHARQGDQTLQSMELSSSMAPAFGFRLIGTIETTGELRCVATDMGGAPLASVRSALSPDVRRGRFGFDARGVGADIHGLAIYERSTTAL